jgi:glycosyltransferase involved in cell wall biosynthesis
MMQPRVSILIPAYNAERWLADTLRSARAQTWPRKEIIVVDDGSTDRTLSVARQFASREISVVSQSNAGAATARNTAFSLCQGDYIQWLDADDLLAPDKIAKQIEALERRASSRTLLSSAWGSFGYRVSHAEFRPTALWCDLSPTEWLLRKLAQSSYLMNACWLVSRELSNAAGPWDTRLSLDDDGEYFCRVLLGSDGVRFVPEAKTYYRRASFGSLSNVGRSGRKLESQLRSSRLQIKYLRALEDSKRTRAAGVKELQQSLIYFHPERPDLVAQMDQLAAELGGRLERPRLQWIYAWLQKLFGWRVAKRAQFLFPMLKHSLLRSWDKALYRLERRSPAGDHI